MMRIALITLIYADFAILLAIATSMLLPSYEYRDRKIFRVATALILVITSVLVAVMLFENYNAYPEQSPSNSLLSAVRYLIIFLSLTAAIYICFKGSFSSILFCCMAGYAIKQLAEDCFYLFGLIPSFPNLVSLSPENAVPGLISFYGCKLLIFCAVYLLIYFLIVHKFNRRIITSKIDHPVLICVALTTLFSFLFNIIRNDHASESFMLNIACILYNLLCCLLIIFLRFGVLEKNTYAHEVLTMHEVWREKEAQLSLFQETIDDINVKYHDLKRSVSLLRADGNRNTDKLINEIEESLGTYDAKTNTGNTTLDTILTQYRLQCEMHKITLSCIANGSLLAGMSSTDLVAFVGNILENAVEAVMKLPEEKRSISFSVTESMGMICVHEENPYHEEITLRDGMPLTSKSNNKYHGFGVRSIQMIVNKYNGHISIDTSDNIFSLNILFEKR